MRQVKAQIRERGNQEAAVWYVLEGVGPASGMDRKARELARFGAVEAWFPKTPTRKRRPGQSRPSVLTLTPSIPGLIFAVFEGAPDWSAIATRLKMCPMRSPRARAVWQGEARGAAPLVRVSDEAMAAMRDVPPRLVALHAALTAGRVAQLEADLAPGDVVIVCAGPACGQVGRVAEVAQGLAKLTIGQVPVRLSLDALEKVG